MSKTKSPLTKESPKKSVTVVNGIDMSSLSDAELTRMLREHGASVGPIVGKNMETYLLVV